MFKASPVIPVIVNGLVASPNATTVGIANQQAVSSDEDLPTVDPYRFVRKKGDFVDTFALADHVIGLINQGHRKIIIDFGTTALMVGKYPMTDAGWVSRVSADITKGRTFEDRIQEKSGRRVSIEEQTLPGSWLPFRRNRTQIIVTVVKTK